MPTTIHRLYNGEIEIEFRENPYHTYKLLGTNERLTSVTSITGIIDFPKDVAMRWAIGLADEHLTSFLVEREGLIDKTELQKVIVDALSKYTTKRDEAASNGSLVHAWAESYARAKLHGEAMPGIGEDLPDQVVAGINGFLDWVNVHKIKFLEVERLVYSKRLGYSGLFDALVLIEGKKILVDYKTSKDIYPGMHAQLAAYRNAYEEEMGQIDGSLIVRFDKETGIFDPHDIDDDSYWKDLAMFEGLLVTKTRLKEIEKTK